MSRRYALVTAIDESLYSFYKDLIPLLLDRGHSVVGISSPGPLHRDLELLGMEVLAIPIAREPSPARDLSALRTLRKTFRDRQFDGLLLSTPKVGFIGSLAAKSSGQSARTIYMVRGRPYETMRGPKRLALAQMDRLACRLSGQVAAVSPSLGEALVSEGICPPQKLKPMGCGSSKGVNTNRFNQSQRNVAAGFQYREELGIPHDGIVVGFTGHLRSEKGVNELLRVMKQLCLTRPKLHLLLVGQTYPERDPLDPDLWTFAQESNRVHITGFVKEPEKAMAAMDIFAFPSHREGFGNAPLEAAAMGLPVVASDIVGLRDAVSFNVTALPVKPHDEDGLANAIARLCDDPDLRRRLGQAGRARVEADFSEQVVLGRVVELLESL